MPPRARKPGVQGIRPPFFANPALYGLGKEDSSRYINETYSNSMMPNGEKYVILKKKSADSFPTRENVHEYAQDDPRSRALKNSLALTVSASAMGNLLGMFDSDSVDILKMKDHLKSKTEHNVFYERIRLLHHYGKFPWEDQQLPREVFTQCGTQMEEYHNVLLAKMFPSYQIHEKGTYYFNCDPEYFDDLLGMDNGGDEREGGKLKRISFTAAESPDAVVYERDEDQCVVRKFTAEYKWLAFLLPKNKNFLDDDFQVYDKYEYSEIPRNPWDKPPPYYVIQKYWQMYGEGVEECHFQALTSKKGGRYWKVPYNKPILTIAVNLIEHVMRTFIVPKDGNHKPVPTNYFTRYAPAKAQLLYRKMLRLIAEEEEKLTHVDISHFDVMDEIMKVQKFIHPEKNIEQIDFWRSRFMPFVPTWYPRFCAVFCFRILLYGDGVDSMKLIVHEGQQIAQREMHLQFLFSKIPTLSFLQKIYDHHCDEFEAAAAKFTESVKSKRDLADITMHLRMNMLSKIEAVVDKAGVNAYLALYPENYNPKVNMREINDIDNEKFIVVLNAKMAKALVHNKVDESSVYKYSDDSEEEEEEEEKFCLDKVFLNICSCRDLLLNECEKKNFHPEYVSLLRDEIDNYSGKSHNKTAIQALVVLTVMDCLKMTY